MRKTFIFHNDALGVGLVEFETTDQAVAWVEYRIGQCGGGNSVDYRFIEGNWQVIHPKLLKYVQKRPYEEHCFNLMYPAAKKAE